MPPEQLVLDCNSQPLPVDLSHDPCQSQLQHNTAMQQTETINYQRAASTAQTLVLLAIDIA